MQSGRRAHKTHSYTVMSLRFITQRRHDTRRASMLCKTVRQHKQLCPTLCRWRLEENALNTRLANCSRQSLKWLGKSHSSGRPTDRNARFSHRNSMPIANSNIAKYHIFERKRDDFAQIPIHRNRRIRNAHAMYVHVVVVGVACHNGRWIRIESNAPHTQKICEKRKAF